jgi:hypothetical protein
MDILVRWENNIVTIKYLNMTTEALVTKGVVRKFDGQTVWFSVEDLKKHYKGVEYHDSDVDEEGYIKASDIFGDKITEKKAKK